MSPPLTWYHAGAEPFPPFPPLEGDAEADVCVIGAGLTGLGAALELAARGVRAIVLEKGRVGSGASGRNGGQVHSGQRRDQRWLEQHVGEADARALWRLAEDAKAHLKNLITRHHIACDWRDGLIVADHKPRFVADSHAHVRYMHDAYDYTRLEALDREALRALVRSPDYHGGYIDHGAGHLNPLKLVCGLAQAAAAAGVAIHEMTEADALDAGDPATVTTPHGRVRAGCVIIAGDALMRGLDAETDARLLPIASTVAVTAPLGARIADFLTSEAAVSDSRFVVNYFRPTPDGRLLFGGGESYSTRPVSDPARLVRAALAQVFPPLRDVTLDHAWSGIVGITRTRLPIVRRVGANAVSAAGYSGHGLALAPFFGSILARAALEPDARFDLLTRLPAPPFPGGARLRQPFLMAAMSYYALRDRL